MMSPGPPILKVQSHVSWQNPQFDGLKQALRLRKKPEVSVSYIGFISQKNDHFMDGDINITEIAWVFSVK